jgi:alpha-ribazole phosphatase
MVEVAQLLCWRHPRAVGAAGHCIGHTDMPVDRRKAKRLAHHIRSHARRHGLTFEVWTSHLQRARDVGQWLRRWGWCVHVDARLAELNFGSWDGQPWADIAWADVQTWEADLLHHAPGGGESLAQLAARVQAFVAESHGAARLVVTHGGWINALVHVPPGTAQLPAASWPPAPRHGSVTVVTPRSRSD